MITAKGMTLVLVLGIMGILGVAVHANENPIVTTEIDWAKVISQANLTWNPLPDRWKQAPFLGNGMMGTMVFQSGDQTVRWQVGRGDVQDHRPNEFRGYRAGTMYTRNRLPIGHFELNTEGTITGGSMTLDIYNAEATGVIETDQGTIRWRSFVPTDHMAIVTEIEPDAGEADCDWVWHPAKAVSPRAVYRNELQKMVDAGYALNPDPVLGKQGDINLCTQPLLAGGETVTAWWQDELEGTRRLIMSVAHSHPEQVAAKQAIATIERVRGLSTVELVEAHRQWWHDYYPQSFVSIPDAYWQQFYWLQMYKLASGTRADRMLLDLNGPWLQRTPWPGTWWNLNVQLTYWPTYASNRLSLGESLHRHLYEQADNLAQNVAEPYRNDSVSISRATGQDLRGNVPLPNGNIAPEPGNMLWALHNCWLHYRHSMNDDTLRDHLYPLLRRAVNYYFHFMTEDADGVLHLRKTFSPEYKHGQGPDTNYDLALLRWACQALIDSADRLGIDDPLEPKWRNTLDHLAPYPVDDNGYMIAADVPFAHRHRHYSHLMMLYPLYLVNIDQPGTERLAIKSIEHWQSFKPYNGYSFTGSSSLYSALGRGNKSLAHLSGMKGRVSKTTMYTEAGPVIESPLSAAQSIHDMLLQSWGDTIRIFPAVPDAWADVAIHDMRAEGAFLISAVREGGKTQWVRIKSLAGEPCRIKPNLTGQVRVAGSRSFKLQPLENGVYTLDLTQGDEALLYVGDAEPGATITPVELHQPAD